METDYSYSVHCDRHDLRSVEEIADEACQRAVNRLNARTLSTGKYPVIFSSRVSKQLIAAFLSAISGTAIYRKSSFLAGTLNQRIFPEHISIYERPHLPRLLSGTYFDHEGVATYDKDFVKNGELCSYILGSYSARKLNMETTGNAGGVTNLFITHSDEDLASLLKQMDTGLLVHELIGQGVSLVTGSYSKGVTGFWVERGVIQFPVAGVTIAGNLKDMFAHIVAVGNDPDPNSHFQIGSILLNEMTIAGSKYTNHK